MKTILITLLTIILITGLSIFREDQAFSSGSGRGNELQSYQFSQSPLDLRNSSINKDETKNKISGDPGNVSGKDEGWYRNAISGIEKNEYNVSFDKGLNSYQSPNRENNMRFIYNKSGFTAKLRDNQIALFDESDKMIEEKDKKYKYLDEWEINFAIESVSKNMNSGIENYYTDFENSEFEVIENKISVENENLRIQYCNDKAGMRQDFIVKKKPEGNDQLRLNLKAETRLNMITGGDALIFTDKSGDRKLKYSSLKVWDANGKELRGYFEKNKNQNGSKSYCIVVNDEDAVYPVTIDPLSSTASWSAGVAQAGANFGWSVATAGDVNGDGYSDVIVGAPYYDNGQIDEGAAFVYHGSMNGLSLTPVWSKEGDQASALFGWSVATAGDIVGAGYSSVIIGSPTYDSGQTDEGRVYVYNGSVSGLSSNFSWKYESNQAGENFGYSVACAGDIDNNSNSDIIIGSPFYDGGQTNEGRVYVFKSFGGVTNVPTWTYEANQNSAHLGFSVAGAMDVDADNYSDILVGAYKYDNAFNNAGRVYSFLSTGVSFASVPNATLDGTQAGEYFGYSVSTAGDVNGDGYTDVIIGAPLFDNGQTDEGKCYLYNGTYYGITAVAPWIKEGDQTGGQLGISVSTAGDVNGDGYADIIVGENYGDNGETDEGRAYIYLGPYLGYRPYISYESNQGGANFGYSVAIAGDINGDGFSDVIVGSYTYDLTDTNSGSAFVFLGSCIDIVSTIIDFSLSQAGANLGYSVSSAGDVDGDGYSDIIMGVPGHDNGQLDEGMVYVSYGPDYDDWSAEINISNSMFGASVSSAGDVNGDGYSDIIVGAPQYSLGNLNEGAAYVYCGSASGLNSSPFWGYSGNQAGAKFGTSVSSAGDLNGDGYSDIIVGAPNYSNGESSEGKVFVFYGSSSGLIAASNVSAEGNQPFGNFGRSVSNAGDVNGDGYSDVIIGADLFDNGQSDEGRAFVYHGSSSGLSLIPGWITESNIPGSRFGYSVSGAGDVNGDGYSDVIVGAPFYEAGVKGASFLYYGSSSGLPESFNRHLTGSGSANQFGYSVSTAGDVNADGYSDVIIGDPHYQNGTTNGGAVFMYKGSHLGIPDSIYWSLISTSANSNFGFSVSTAGDYNGDGFSDIFYGAPGLGGGRAYLRSFSNSVHLRKKINQFKHSSFAIVASNGLSGSNGSIRLQQDYRSPFGITLCRIALEVRENGVPFEGVPISNNTAGNIIPGSFTNPTSSLMQDITGLNPDKLYKWRSRIEYKISSSPFQKYGPWKYYNNYSAISPGGFRPRKKGVNLNLTMLVEGRFNSTTNSMITDTAKIILRSGTSPYPVIDSSITVISSSGTANVNFRDAVSSVPYYIVLQHRNSIETWSSTAQSFVSDNLSYDFTDAANKAFGNNMKQIDSSPLKFGIFSGDVNKDNSVDLNDLTNIYNDANSFLSGYVQTDITGDDLVDLNDITIAYNNAAAFVSVIRP